MNKFGLIGAGLIGGTLARRLAVLGHEVKIANSKAPSTLIGFDVPRITPAWATDALRGVDVAIISVPQSAIACLSEEVLVGLRQAPIVIDTGNYYPNRDGRIDMIDEGLADSEWVAKQLGRPVFKVFNSIGAVSLLKKGRPFGAKNRIALPVAGPAGSNKRRVMSLVDELGFDPVDGGELNDSWRQQPGTPAYCADLTAAELSKQIARATVRDSAQYQWRRDSTDTVAGSARQRQMMANDHREAR
ncbi:NADPH-dependent F420 reductase [Arthrobacter mobilis]|uniref:NAD(P)-binding domain-containing protein n=1 Tax=Arthrobacter mobilis TaxID=2724944 RepID=A0A7X6K7Q0_9MICC|nr:NAD(P)-binding domain-containing protein [Arthrobacter mobilis]NKX56683.1 NAD(P)-binding domain-containing protein [Arthrobacter mobilis]